MALLEVDNLRVEFPTRRGVLTAVLRPCSLAAVIKAHGFNEALFYECIDDLRAHGRLPGRNSVHCFASATTWAQILQARE